MRREPFRDLHFIPHDFFPFVGILLAAVVAADLYFLRQHGKSGVRICLPEQDLMLVPDIALVMEATILADNNPIVVSRVLLRVRPPKFPKTLEKSFVPLCPMWSGTA
jgi:hypothetical protein